MSSAAIDDILQEQKQRKPNNPPNELSEFSKVSFLLLQKCNKYNMKTSNRVGVHSLDLLAKKAINESG